MDERKHDDRRANGKVKEVVRGVGKCIFICTQQVQQRYPEYQHQDTHQHADQKGGVKAEGAHPLNAFAIPLSKQPGNQRAAALREDISTAITVVNSGMLRDTPATMFVSLVCATKKVSANCIPAIPPC